MPRKTAEWRLIGDKELKRKLGRLGDAMRGRAVLNVLATAAKPAVQAAKRTVPFGKPGAYSGNRQPGNLWRSIGVKRYATRGKYRLKPAVAVGPRRKKGSPEGQGWHGWMVEYGTAKGKGRGKNQRGQRYMQRAMNSSQGQMQGRIKDGLKRLVLRYTKRGLV